MKTFEDLVAEINSATSMWDMSKMSLADIQQGLTDLQNRLQALEQKVASLVIAAVASGSMVPPAPSQP